MNKASILFKEECRQFHLTNGDVSYIFQISGMVNSCSFTTERRYRAEIILIWWSCSIGP